MVPLGRGQVADGLQLYIPFCAHCYSSAQLFLLVRAACTSPCCTPVTGLERTPCEGSPSPSAPCSGLQSLSSSAHTQQLQAGKCCCGPALGAVGNTAGKRSQPHAVTVASAGKGESHRGWGAAEGSRLDARVCIFAVGSAVLRDPQGQGSCMHRPRSLPRCVEVYCQRQEMSRGCGTVTEHEVCFVLFI